MVGHRQFSADEKGDEINRSKRLKLPLVIQRKVLQERSISNSHEKCLTRKSVCGGFTAIFYPKPKQNVAIKITAFYVVKISDSIRNT